MIFWDLVISVLGAESLSVLGCGAVVIGPNAGRGEKWTV